MVFRVFYEAARNLDSPPSSRTDRVEACRPRGCLLVWSLAAPASAGGRAPAGSSKKATRARAALRTRPPDPRSRFAGGTASHLMASLFAARFRVEGNVTLFAAQAQGQLPLVRAPCVKNGS